MLFSQFMFQALKNLLPVLKKEKASQISQITASNTVSDFLGKLLAVVINELSVRGVSKLSTPSNATLCH